MTLPRAVCILGPTGVGKTGLALHLAERFGGGVINTDSRQVYRGLGIVTAQPTAEEQAKCPHRLYAIIDPCQAMSAGTFTVLAEQAMTEFTGQGLLPLLVGGTGLYLDALLYGLASIPDVPDVVRQQIQAGWEALGARTMYDFLSQIDPDYAAKIHHNDRQRITRALEVFESTGRVFSSFHQQEGAPPRFDALKIGLSMDTEKLSPRLMERIEAMLAAGALREMEEAFAACPKVDAPGFSGIGSHELLELARGRLDLEQAKTLWHKRTKAYAKRQMTWFKRDPDIHWFSPSEHEAVAALVADWLETG
ncbi:tRNA dimethylallyltransferase [Alkalidesulfovibrio alkalitolerans DSM 16529]|uniref:tRNA dimethylallyltransferase n=1 Tax=Alkalidesulfovibrio alkalitolerans DSM 16529 TaxID=1121439 RepID=S7UH51_9BACT|nr:tRNA (adenosine(37)-N6)-dimethylallyltransferase MiaA [Alkalidesulfovibrio alkalitolerans]EPR31588.1 tRNA dimethylallyltransferase [Alkalidesulfovibrio alkalitolerans DSM 16529]